MSQSPLFNQIEQALDDAAWTVLNKVSVASHRQLVILETPRRRPWAVADSVAPPWTLADLPLITAAMRFFGDCGRTGHRVFYIVSALERGRILSQAGVIQKNSRSGDT